MSSYNVSSLYDDILQRVKPPPPSALFWLFSLIFFIKLFTQSASSSTGSIKARFENIAKQKEEEDRRRAEEERARRQATEKREQEEARRKAERSPSPTPVSQPVSAAPPSHYEVSQV